MDKRLFSILSDIESTLFELEEISNTLYVFHGAIGNEIDFIINHFLGGAPEFKARIEQIMSVLTLSQKALTIRRLELSEAVYKAYDLATPQKNE